MRKIFLVETTLTDGCYECGYSVESINKIYEPLEVTDEEYYAIKGYSQLRIIEVKEGQDTRAEISRCVLLDNKRKEEARKRDEKNAKRAAKLEKGKLERLKKQKAQLEKQIEAVKNASQTT